MLIIDDKISINPKNKSTFNELFSLVYYFKCTNFAIFDFVNLPNFIEVSTIILGDSINQSNFFDSINIKLRQDNLWNFNNKIMIYSRNFIPNLFPIINQNDFRNSKIKIELNLSIDYHFDFSDLNYRKLKKFLDQEIYVLVLNPRSINELSLPINKESQLKDIFRKNNQKFRLF